MDMRQAEYIRKSRETEIKADLNIDGKGETKIKTKIPFLDHMLELFAFHGFFDLSLGVLKNDEAIDLHHTNEDVGIVLGKVFNKALGEKKGIKRFGVGFAPMESCLGRTVVDISGRGYLSINIAGKDISSVEIKAEENYSLTYLEHFMESFAHGLAATINIYIDNPSADLHTNVEAVFKSLGLALDQATQIDPRRPDEVPSTKGIID